MRKNLLTGIIITIVIITLDTLTQSWVFSELQGENKVIPVTPFFNLVEVWNPGVSFGMFQQLVYGQWILSALALAIIVVLSRMLCRTTDRIHAVAYSLIIGGASGNVLDRILHGAVADYLDFHAFGYHWPAFNVTDGAIFIGVVFLLLPFCSTMGELRTERKEGN